MRLPKLPRPFSGAGPARPACRTGRPNPEAPTERISGDGQRPPTEKRSVGASAWLLEHRLVWLVVVAFTLGAVLLSPAASFALTRSGAAAAVNAALAFLVVSLLWLMKRHYEIIHKRQEEFLRRAQDLEKSHGAIVQLLRTAVDLRDPVGAEHSDRVSELMAVLTRQLGLRQQELRDITLAATLHDIGKIGVADAVLSRSGPLGDEEWAEMRQHPLIGYKILKGIDFLQGAAEIVYAHHERYDGSGYPRGLAGEKIPVGARIFAVVDAYDAMTSYRPYRKATSHYEALEEIDRHAGSQFDPKVVGAFLRADQQGLIRHDLRRQADIDTLVDVPSGD